MLCLIALSVALAAPVPSSPPAGDWAQFRGPTAQGHADAKRLPTEWDETKNVAWKVEIPGGGWSSPVVAGGKIYLTTAVPNDKAMVDRSLRALALDAATGKTLWDVEVFQQDAATAPRIHAKNSHASPTPMVVGDRLFVHFGHYGTSCLETATGKRVWANTENGYKPVHGGGGSPLVADGKVFVLIDGTDKRQVVAYDAATGKVAWLTKRTHPARKPFSFNTPLLVTVAGRKTLVAVGSDVMSGYDPADGKELWSVTFDGYSIVPRPVFGHELIFFSTGYDSPTVMAVKVERAGDGFAATVAWKSKEGAPRNSSPLLVGDELYLVSDEGIFTCRDATTGKVHWNERVPGAYSASLLFGAGNVYLQNEAGVGSVFKATKDGPEAVGGGKLPGRTLASYAVDGEALLIRTDTHLYKIR